MATSTAAITTNTTVSLLPSNGIPVSFSVTGTWGGATATIEGSVDGTGARWAPVAVFSSTDTFIKNSNLTSGCLYRVTVTGGSGHSLIVDQN